MYVRVVVTFCFHQEQSLIQELAGLAFGHLPRRRVLKPNQMRVMECRERRLRVANVEAIWDTSLRMDRNRLVNGFVSIQ